MAQMTSSSKIQISPPLFRGKLTKNKLFPVILLPLVAALALNVLTSCEEGTKPEIPVEKQPIEPGVTQVSDYFIRGCSASSCGSLVNSGIDSASREAYNLGYDTYRLDGEPAENYWTNKGYGNMADFCQRYNNSFGEYGCNHDDIVFRDEYISNMFYGISGFYNGINGTKNSGSEHHNDDTKPYPLVIASNGFDFSATATYSDGSEETVWPCFNSDHRAKGREAYLALFRKLHPRRYAPYPDNPEIELSFGFDQ